MAWAVIQEGGSSREFYVHVLDTEDDATDYRFNCGTAAYATTDPVEMPESTDWVALAKLAGSIGSLECLGIPEHGHCRSCGARDNKPHFDDCEKE
ncbi:hypothetical protein [Nocardia altamirensis]|uniref:hypothetical protein n=1 Tax=Nocardia altamirensis TaxID=472158 RepID=UPI00114CFB99|nr:hypothetical protein [Nocardia altamirensis]